MRHVLAMVIAVASLVVALGGEPQYAPPYSPFCPHGPEAGDCFLNGS